MAKRVIHQLIDDLDGGVAEQTTRFSIDGVLYEIDLSTKNYNKFIAEISRYADAGTRVGRVQEPPRSITGRPAYHAPDRSAVSRERNQEIRTWLTATGFEVPTRGRIRGELVNLWENRASNTSETLRAALAQWGTPEMQKSAINAAKTPAKTPAKVPAQKPAPAAVNGAKTPAKATKAAAAK